MLRFGFSILVLILLAPAAMAHHNFNAIFNMKEYEVLDLTVEQIRWKNPHTLIRGVDAKGTTWTLETGPVNIISRAGVDRRTVVPGHKIRARGNPARSGKPMIWVRNLLKEDGQEILLANGKPYFTQENQIGVGTKYAFGDVEREDDRVTFFRTWGVVAGSDSRYLPKFNDQARVEQQDYERAEGANCLPPGMPRAFNQRHPIQFIDKGDYITLRGEEFDAVRTVWLKPPTEQPPPSLYGYSVGTIDDGILSIETTLIDYPVFTVEGPFEGAPQSPEARVVETYTLADEGLLLHYESTLHDQRYLAKPFTFTQSYHQQPGLEILPWACTN